MTFSHVGLCPLNVWSTLDSAYVSFSPFESLFTWVFSTWILSIWESVHMTFSPHRSSPARRSFQSCLAHLLVRLFVSRSNWVLVYLLFVYFGVWPHDFLST